MAVVIQKLIVAKNPCFFFFRENSAKKSIHHKPHTNYCAKNKLLTWQHISYCAARKSHLRIPVGVVEDDDICCGEVDAQPSSTSRKQEQEFRRPRLIELVHLSMGVRRSQREGSAFTFDWKRTPGNGYSWWPYIWYAAKRQSYSNE